MKLLREIQLFEIVLAMILVFTGIIAITAVLLLIGVNITFFNILMPVIFASFFLYIRNQSVTKTLLTMFIVLFISSIFIIVSGSVYDVTWDGAAYHKTAIGFLKEGWNPVYLSAKRFNELSGIISFKKDFIWSEVYPKGIWFFAASVYKLTGNIESGKAYTLIFMFITFGLFYDYLSSKKMGLWKRIGIAAFAGLNPICLAQMQSFYIDGLVGSVLICLLLLMIGFHDSRYNRNRNELYIMIVCLIVIGCNTKFSVALFVISYCFIFYLYSLLVESGKIEKIKMTMIFAFSGIFSFLIVGFAPYVTNYIRYESPFHGLSGLMTKDFKWVTFGFPGLNDMQMFFASLFGKMSHGEYKSLNGLLKIPFTFSFKEFDYYNYVDTRLGGFGIFFSGLLIVSICLLIYWFVKNIGKTRRETVLAVILLVAGFAEILMLPATFNARYIPQLYVIPIAALIVGFLLFKDGLFRNKISIGISLFLMIVMLFNIMPYAKVFTVRWRTSSETTACLKRIGEVSKEKKIDVAFYCDEFNGLNFNLRDNAIRYNLFELEKMTDKTNSMYSNWIYYSIGK